MIVFTPTWQDMMLLIGLQYGRVLTVDEMRFLLWECTAYPVAGVIHVQRQMHEALAEPRINRCHCCGTPVQECVGYCCDDCYHPAEAWAERLGKT